jgi:hypothetical protein
LLVKALTHFLAGLEVRHALPIDSDGSASFGIAADSRRVLFHPEGTEAAKLDVVAARHRRDYFFENDVDDLYNITLTKVRVLPQDALG